MDSFISWVIGSPEKSLPTLGAAIGLVLGGFWTALTFFHKVWMEREEKQFIRYHKLVEELNKGRVNSKGEPEVYVDYQLNSVYEMRFFPKYYPRSERIIELLIPRWKISDSYNDQNVRDLETTLRYIRIRKSPIGRFFLIITEAIWPWYK